MALKVFKPAFYILNKAKLTRLIQRCVVSKCNRKLLQLRSRSHSLFCLLLLPCTHALYCQQVIDLIELLISDRRGQPHSVLKGAT